MSDAKVAPSRASMEERLKAGDRRFSRLEARIDRSDQETRQHLRSQDEKIDELVRVVQRVDQNTSSIIETWNDGARAVRFFCRLAQGWRFMLTEVAKPVIIPALIVYAGWYYSRYHQFPTFITDVYKFVKALL
jgi:hypothetical protein